jgi:hypothetical protein
MLGLFLMEPGPVRFCGHDRSLRASSQVRYSVQHVSKNKRRCARRGMICHGVIVDAT